MDAELRCSRWVLIVRVEERKIVVLSHAMRHVVGIVIVLVVTVGNQFVRYLFHSFYYRYKWG